MARDFIISGETLVSVKGMTGTPIAAVQELGLASDEILVVPHFSHRDLHIDDFGPDIPPEVLWMLSTVSIHMTLVHFDNDILRTCITESMAGGTEGTMVGAGTPMGGGADIFSDKNHYISLSLSSAQLLLPWRFRSTYLAELPVEYPLGTGASLVRLNWRAIPYYPPTSTGDLIAGTAYRSTGRVLWDRSHD